MISTSTLKNSIDQFYQITNIPICLLDENNLILQQPITFYTLQKDFYKKLLANVIGNDKIQINYSNSDITLFIPYQKDDIYKISIGPLIIPNTIKYKNTNEISFLRYVAIKDSIHDVLEKIAYFDDSSVSYIRIFYQFVKDEIITMEDIRKILHQDKFNKNHILVSELIILKRDYESNIYAYQGEQQFLDFVKSGDSLSARSIACELLSTPSEALAGNQLQSDKYKIVAAIALVTRAVIECGISLDKCYATSDIYIRKLDQTQALEQLHDIFMNCIIDFCTLVKTHKSQYPSWVRKCIEYINQNLHKELTLTILSKHLHMSSSYISVQFKKIYGISIREYINEKKIEESKFLMKYSQLSISEIISSLNYSSQSYFTKVFKKYAHMLPSEYQEKYCR